jgi:FtsP/CotA-like multicopper oxidase with cupredoxin domain
MINGKSYGPEYRSNPLNEGLRHRLVFDNRSMDDHPVHLHRHALSWSPSAARLSGITKMW